MTEKQKQDLINGDLVKSFYSDDYYSIWEVKNDINSDKLEKGIRFKRVCSNPEGTSFWSEDWYFPNHASAKKIQYIGHKEKYPEYFL